MSLYSQLFLRDTNSPYGDINRNSTLSFKDLDQNFLFLKERDINQLRVDGSDLIYETLGGTEYSVNIGGASSNTFVTGFTFNSPSTYDLTIEQNGGESPLTVDLSSLASDVYVISGSYDPSTGDVEFTNSTGGTFVVSGFTTGMTDTYVTGGTLTGTNLVLEKSNGVDTSAIDLSSLSGSTPNLQQVMDVGSTATLTSGTFIVKMEDTATDYTNIWANDSLIQLYNKESGTEHCTLNISNTNAHYTSQNSFTDISRIGMTNGVDLKWNDGTNDRQMVFNTSGITITDTITSKGLEYAADYGTNGKTDPRWIPDWDAVTGLTSSLSDIYVTGGTYNSNTLTLNRNDGNTVVVTGFTSSGETNTASNVGGANEVFSGKSGTDLYFRTISGGTNTTVTTVGDIIKIDSTGGGGGDYLPLSGGTLTGDLTIEPLTGTTNHLVESDTTGKLVQGPEVIEAYISDPTAQVLLENTSNWDINGNYTGTTAITGTYQGQSHFDNNYWFTAISDNNWIRLIRG